LAVHLWRTALGRGSFGLVQAAIDAETGEEYAIKELSRARLRRKAQREAHRRAREIRQVIASSEGRAPEPSPESLGYEQTATQIDALYLIRNEVRASFPLLYLLVIGFRTDCHHEKGAPHNLGRPVRA
jgi:serine/threonine protein kinase